MVAAAGWTDVTSGVLDIAQVVAILGAASWAYFKFVRGRTFAERLEASVDATAFRRAGVSGLRVRVGLTNTGASLVALTKDVNVVYVYATPVTDAIPGTLPEWGRHVLVAPIMEHHGWIEAQETIRDEALMIVPDHRMLAYQVEFIVGSQKNMRWTARTIVPTADAEDMTRIKRCEEVDEMRLDDHEKLRIRRDREEQVRHEQELRMLRLTPDEVEEGEDHEQRRRKTSPKK
jgi:hypothetical protein